MPEKWMLQERVDVHLILTLNRALDLSFGTHTDFIAISIKWFPDSHE